MDFDMELERAKIERQENWRDIIKQVPPIKFKPSWEVCIIPPFAGAVARFTIKKDKANVSVYLDWHSRLGVVSQPYWEIYPSKTGDTDRFYLSEVDEMIEAIGASISNQNRRKP